MQLKWKDDKKKWYIGNIFLHRSKIISVKPTEKGVKGVYKFLVRAKGQTRMPKNDVEATFRISVSRNGIKCFRTLIPSVGCEVVLTEQEKNVIIFEIAKLATAANVFTDKEEKGEEKEMKNQEVEEIDDEEAYGEYEDEFDDEFGGSGEFDYE